MLKKLDEIILHDGALMLWAVLFFAILTSPTWAHGLTVPPPAGMCGTMQMAPNQRCTTVTGYVTGVNRPRGPRSGYSFQVDQDAVRAECASGLIHGQDGDDYLPGYQTPDGEVYASLGAAWGAYSAIFANATDGCGWQPAASGWWESYLYQFPIPSDNCGLIYRAVQPICTGNAIGYLEHRGYGDDRCVVGAPDEPTVTWRDDYARVISSLTELDQITVQYVTDSDGTAAGTCFLPEDGVRFTAPPE